MSTSDTITWQVREAFQTALSEISVANGYRTDIGLNVHLEPEDVAEDDASILISMTDIQANSDLSISRRQRTASIDIEAAVPSDWSNASKTIDAALDDIEQAITKSRDTCLAPVGVSRITLNNADMPPLADDSTTAIGTWHLEITYIRK